MVIGGASWYTAYDSPVDIDQFAFYSSALTANQITATYDATLARLNRPTRDMGSSPLPPA